VEYQFSYDEYDRPLADFSMEHQAIGYWLSSEVSNNLSLCEEILTVVEQLLAGRIQQREFSGQQFQLLLSSEEAEVRDQALADEKEYAQDLPDESLELYDEESQAGCGLEDFLELMQSWFEFISE